MKHDTHSIKFNQTWQTLTQRLDELSELVQTRMESGGNISSAMKTIVAELSDISYTLWYINSGQQEGERNVTFKPLPTYRCIGDYCRNRVMKDGQLCFECSRGEK